jgi:hypothetical protein
MTNKIKLIFPVLALGLILGSTAFAATTTKEEATEIKTGTTEAKGVKEDSVITTVKTQTPRSLCITTAKTTRSASIKSANDIAKQAKIDAKTAKNSAITIAKANTDKIAKAAAIKDANTTYKKAIKDANTTLIASLKTIKVDYSRALKACPVK